MAGLAPTIHAAPPYSVDMDARNKSGHDDGIESRRRSRAPTVIPRTSETGRYVFDVDHVKYGKMAGKDDADEVRTTTAPLDSYRQDHVSADGGDCGDPILSLRGTGRALWAEEDADAYASRLRQGWE